jgi:antirestriction protein ArdC
VFWKFTEVFKPGQDPDDENSERERRCWLRYYTVFNAAQCEGLKVVPASLDVKPLSSIETAQQLADGYLGNGGPGLDRGGVIPCYNFGTDTVRMPVDAAFSGNAEAYYATLFHELTHSTGHLSRLDRGLVPEMFDRASYSREELTAELGASYLCALSGIDAGAGWLDNAAAYIQGWSQALRDDSRAVVCAAARAQKAVDYMIEKAGLDEFSPAGVDSGTGTEPVAA